MTTTPFLVFTDTSGIGRGSTVGISIVPTQSCRYLLSVFLHFEDPHKFCDQRNDWIDTVRCAAPKSTITTAAGRLCSQMAAHR